MTTTETQFCKARSGDKVQTIDERCNELARNAIAAASETPLHRNAKSLIAFTADHIIALRTAELAASRCLCVATDKEFYECGRCLVLAANAISSGV